MTSTPVLTQSVIQFPDTEVGTNCEVGVSFTNGPFATCRLRWHGVGDQDSRVFHPRGMMPSSLAQGATTILPVVFEPKRFGQHEARLTLVAEAGGAINSQHFSLVGNGIPPRRLSYLEVNVPEGQAGKVGRHHHIVVSNERFLLNMIKRGKPATSIITIPVGTERGRVGSRGLRPGEFSLEPQDSLMDQSEVVAYGFYLQRVAAKSVDRIHTYIDTPDVVHTVQEVIRHALKNPADSPPCNSHCIGNQGLMSMPRKWVDDLVRLSKVLHGASIPSAGSILAVPSPEEDRTLLYVVLAPQRVTEYLWRLHRDNVIALVAPARLAGPGDATQLGIVCTQGQGSTPSFCIDVHAFGLARVQHWIPTGMRIGGLDLDSVRDQVRDLLGV